MSEDKVQDSPSDDDSPSADEVVDDLTEEMGVDESDESEADDESEEAPDEETSEGEEASGDDESEDPDASEDEETSDDTETSDDGDESDESDAEDEPESEASSDEADAESDDDTDSTDSPREGDPGRGPGANPILEPDDTGHIDVNADVDVDEFMTVDAEGEARWLNKRNIGIVLAVSVAILGALYFVTQDEHGNVYTDIGLLLQGQYLDEMQRRVDAVEEEFIAAQEEVIPEYGNLFISGSPQEALIHLNGQVQYGEVPSGGLWRELRVAPDTVIEDLPVNEDHEIKITHPGFEPYEITLTEEMWEPAGAGYGYNLTVNLIPEGIEAHREFHRRMQTDTEERGEERFTGTVDFKTTPPGANLKINSYFARNEDGERIETPAELEEYWVYEIDVAELEEEGILGEVAGDQEALDEALDEIETDVEEAKEDEELDEVDRKERLSELDPRDFDIDEQDVPDELKELEEEPRTFPVDRPPDRGDSIQIIYPEDHPNSDELYDYATMLQRAMWKCEWKDDEERERLDDDAPIQEHCNYTYEFDKNFNEIAEYIESRKEERERVEEERYEATEQLDNLEEEFDEKLRALGHTIEDVQRISPEEGQAQPGQGEGE